MSNSVAGSSSAPPRVRTESMNAIVKSHRPTSPMSMRLIRTIGMNDMEAKQWRRIYSAVLCSLAMTIDNRTGIGQQKPLKTGAREKQAADFSVRIAAAERALTQAEFAYYKTASSTSVIAEEGERNPTVTAPLHSPLNAKQREPLHSESRKEPASRVLQGYGQEIVH